MMILATWGDEVVKIIGALGGIAGITGLVIAILSRIEVKLARRAAADANNAAADANKTAAEARGTANANTTTQAASVANLSNRANSIQEQLTQVAKDMPAPGAMPGAALPPSEPVERRTST